MAADPKTSEGARMERKAVLARLRRMKRDGAQYANIDVLLRWMLKRDERYDKAKGGLGRK